MFRSSGVCTECWESSKVLSAECRPDMRGSKEYCPEQTSSISDFRLAKKPGRLGSKNVRQVLLEIVVPLPRDEEGAVSESRSYVTWKASSCDDPRYRRVSCKLICDYVCQAPEWSLGSKVLSNPPPLQSPKASVASAFLRTPVLLRD